MKMDGVFELLRWADSQGDDLASALEAYASGECTEFFTRLSPDEAWVEHAIRPIGQPPADIKFKVGQVIHSYRKVLDHLVCRLAEKNGAVDISKVAFPFGETESGWRQSKKQKIAALSPEARQYIESLKSYKGGNDTLAKLHYLDLSEKHRDVVHLCPVGVMANAKIKKIIGGVVRFGGDFRLIDGGYVFARTTAGAEFEGEMNIQVSLAFRDSDLTRNQPIMVILDDISRELWRIVNKVEEEFF